MNMSNKKIQFAIIGLGDRGSLYASCAESFSDVMELTAIADINPEKLKRAAEKYNIPSDRCFSSAEELLQQKKLADVLCIATLDQMHYQQAIAGLRKGYHLLLEKPISPNPSECKEIAKVAHETNRNVVVCHVLRYTPFYSKLKEIVDSGKIGEIVSIQAIEQVSYWHQAHSFVRGNWRNSETTSPMILQKSCHDMDILLWLAGKSCKRVSSFGGLKLFRRENMPEGATERCTDDCKVKDECPYNAVKYYLGNIKEGNLGWPTSVVLPNATPEKMVEVLKTSPYGRCVYACDNNVVDHQVVAMELDGGATIDFTMCAFTKSGSRRTHIMGTLGDIEADMGKNWISVNVFGQESEVIDVSKLADDFSGHGGGDVKMVREFIDLLLNGDKKAALTSVDKSVESHFVALAAEKSRLNGGMAIDMQDYVKNI